MDSGGARRDGELADQGAALVGRHHTIQAFGRVLQSVVDGGFRVIALAGDPGVGKTRLLHELTALAREREVSTLWGRAAEYERIVPFSVLADALDDRVETRWFHRGPFAGSVDPQVLSGLFPALAATADPQNGGEQGVMARYRLFRALRRLIGEFTGPGLALVLDDLHWADDSSMEFLHHLVRHPPRGGMLIAIAYRPAQVSVLLSALLRDVSGHLTEIEVGPLTENEVEEFLGPGVPSARRAALWEASQGNPFYLEALAHMNRLEIGELPATVRAAIQHELDKLSPVAMTVARGAALVADEFDPESAAVAARVSEPSVLDALDELVRLDIIRQGSGNRFRFRHPLVRHAAHQSSGMGWRVLVHARLAAHLIGKGASAVMTAPHVERSARFADQRAIEVLVAAARTVAATAPASAAHWLRTALALLPEEPSTAERRCTLLMELGRAQGVSGQLRQGRDTVRELLRLLPYDDYERRARAATLCALLERQLDRPCEARALLLDELRRVPEPHASAAVPLRMRLVAESMMRGDFRMAHDVLAKVGEPDGAGHPGLPAAVAALRSMPAYAARRTAEALRHADEAGRLLANTIDDHLVDWLDSIAWLCWGETVMGRYDRALGLFERAATIARMTGQNYILTHLLAGKARTLIHLGRLAEAAATAAESVADARSLRSGQQLVFALTQQCLAASWAGNHDAAMAAADEARRTGVGDGEVWSNQARYARGVALINRGMLDEGVQAVIEVSEGFTSRRMDRGTMLAGCELVACVEASRGRNDKAAARAADAARLADHDLPVSFGLATLAQAHALLGPDPSAGAALAVKSAGRLEADGRRLDSGRALFTAALAQAEQRQPTGAGHVQPAPRRRDPRGGLIDVQHMGEREKGTDQLDTVGDEHRGLGEDRTHPAG
ncbi:ATP-binding protein [Nonomuraea antimicrobica]|uniref:ATP-binding protein n=1 Tax=Nonomuraea antimicrobica TaxID=561173 RepID=UPI0031EEA6D4